MQLQLVVVIDDTVVLLVIFNMVHVVYVTSYLGGFRYVLRGRIHKFWYWYRTFAELADIHKCHMV